MFRRIKKLYSIRSKIVHGDPINKATHEVEKELRELNREILLKILTEENFNNFTEFKKDLLDRLDFG